MLRLTVTVITMALLTGCNSSNPPPAPTVQQEQLLSAEQAVEILKSRIVDDRLYTWTTLDRLNIEVMSVGDTMIDIVINEIHLGDDGADPMTGPTVNFFRVNRRTGGWEVVWPAPGEGWLSYDAWLVHR